MHLVSSTTLLLLVAVVLVIGQVSLAQSNSNQNNNNGPHHGGNRYRILNQFQGGPGDQIYGDLFGTPLALNGKNLFIGALYADGIPFANGSSRPRAGRTFIYTHNNNNHNNNHHDAGFVLSQEFVGESSYDLNSGTNLASEGKWFFDPEVGTPNNQDDPALKDSSGNIKVYKRGSNGDHWVFHQKITNPDGNGPDQQHAEFGLNLAYTKGTDGSGGWLLVGGGRTNKAWFYRYDKHSRQWIVAHSVTTHPTNKFNLLVAIDGKWAFIQVPLDVSTFDNLQVLVYKREGSTWIHHQTISGTGNTGDKKSFLGDLFGSPMAIDGRNAIIGAPGDAEAQPGGYNLPGAAYFLRLNNDEQWTIAQKIFSDQPSLLFGFGNCIKGNTVIVADTGRSQGTNQFQGALRVYERRGSVWEPREWLVDPQGRSFDYFSTCAINENYIVGGSSRAAAQFIPDLSFTGEARPGRVVVWERDD